MPDADPSARRVFVYEVKLCREDGGKGSGWSVTVVTDSTDPVDLLRVARIAADEKLRGNAPRTFGDGGGSGAERWTGLDEAKLLHVASLDPKVAA